jgi:holo-[acyl-carrier protein] synthase
MAEKIIGIGTDIINISRIANLYQKHPISFAQKILHPKEIEQYRNINPAKQPSYLAKRFAGKEATAKAFGTGIRGGLDLKHIAILNDEYGAPYVIIDPEANTKYFNYEIKISLTDDFPFAAAFVIITTTI